MLAEWPVENRGFRENFAGAKKNSSWRMCWDNGRNTAIVAMAVANVM